MKSVQFLLSQIPSEHQGNSLTDVSPLSEILLPGRFQPRFKQLKVMKCLLIHQGLHVWEIEIGKYLEVVYI